jgi:hypothetical protein
METGWILKTYFDYDELVEGDDFGRVFVNPKVSIESGRRKLCGNNFMTKDVAMGDWTFHLNKYQTHENTGALK